MLQVIIKNEPTVGYILWKDNCLLLTDPIKYIRVNNKIFGHFIHETMIDNKINTQFTDDGIIYFTDKTKAQEYLEICVQTFWGMEYVQILEVKINKILSKKQIMGNGKIFEVMLCEELELV